MTKYQLMKALEPFDDEVEIVFQDREHKYMYVPNVYYGLDNIADGARIIFASNKPEGKKWVELKV